MSGCTSNLHCLAYDKKCELRPRTYVFAGVGSFRNQLRHVSRRLVRSPLFAVVTLLTIGIGVGANTAIFSVVNGILLRPLPYADPDRLVSVLQSAPSLGLS